MSTSTTVQPERILKDLQQLWAQMAVDQADAGGVLRACAMTLVVVAAEDGPDADRIRQTVGVLMHNHPSRAVIVRPGAEGSTAEDSALDARIFAECWKPFGKAQQICSEGIEITSPQSGLSEVARFLVPLRVPDLPVVLWCRGAAALEPGRLEPLFPLADKIIFDSAKVADADSALQFLRRLNKSGKRVADLHWTRLTGWREVLAHLFDDGALKPQQVATAQVSFAGPRVTTCARYFAAWIRAALPATRVTIDSRGADAGPPGLRSVKLSTSSDSLTITGGSDHCVEVSGCGRHYRSPLPSTSEEALMQEELGILGPDPVYERALSA